MVNSKYFIQMTTKGKLLVVAIIGAISTFIGIIGWIRIGTMAYVLMHLVGLAIFLESVLLAYQIKPIPSSIRKYILNIIFLIILGIATGVFLFDITGLFIFHLWGYPIFSPVTNIWGYATRMSMGWGLYFLIFHQSYLLLYHLLHKRHHHILLSSERRKLLAFIGPTGVVLMLFGAAFPSLMDSPALSGFIMVAGTWFVLEGFEWPRKHRTLLLDLLSGNIRPLIAIVVGALLVGFLSEFANISSTTQQWIYYNNPWENITIFNVPVFLLLSWSFMYIIFLSLENIFVRTETAIWD